MLIPSQTPAPVIATPGDWWLVIASPIFAAGFVTALVAGVGLWVNGRRERTRDAEQRQDQRDRDALAREDQRERDALALAEQQRRDREQFDREDQHRFTTHKRTLYAETMAMIVIVGADLRVKFGFSVEVPLMGPSDVAVRLATLISSIYLIAPPEVSAAAFDVMGRINYFTASPSQIDPADPAARDAMYQVSAASTELQQAMRQDLGVAEVMPAEDQSSRSQP